MIKADKAAPDSLGSRHLPLRGKTIVVTRARAQSGEITSQLEALGATVIHCPTIEVVPPSSWAPLDAAIGRVREYDWIVFTSPNAIDFFLGRLREKEGDHVKALSQTAICAIGPATSQTLEAAGLAASVVASASTDEGALAAIVEHLGRGDRVAGLRFLIPRAKVARDVLPAGLQRLGGLVDAVEAYQTVKTDVDGVSITRLFNETSIDVITFTSSSTVSNFSTLVGSRDLSVLLSNTLVACIGPVTAETAAKHGLEKTIQPETYNISALVVAIVNAIDQG